MNIIIIIGIIILTVIGFESRVLYLTCQLVQIHIENIVFYLCP